MLATITEAFLYTIELWVFLGILAAYMVIEPFIDKSQR